MDGTLLGDDGRVSPRNLAALLAAQAAGILVVVATGRRHSYAMHVLRPLGLHHASVLVSSNGTVTRTLGSSSSGSSSSASFPADPIPSQLIARTHLPHATALWLCGHVDEFRNALVLTFDRVGPDGDDTRGALVVEHLDNLTASIGRWMADNEPYIAHVIPIERALDAANSDAPIQAMLCGTIERMTRAEARLLEHPGVSASGHPSGRSGRTMNGPATTEAGAPHFDSETTPGAPQNSVIPTAGGAIGVPGELARWGEAIGVPGELARWGERLASEMWDSSHQTSGVSTHPTPLLTLNRTEYPARDLSILDILPAGCSKGAAILSLAATHGIAPAQILAIGDNWNDVSMLEIAGSAVLMANAPPDLKLFAASRGWPIAPPNSADGVAHTIESALAIPC
jgi:hydroxymethylpyrimidine pyrophosphatase-like HAD family hydrolase